VVGTVWYTDESCSLLELYQELMVHGFKLVVKQSAHRDLSLSLDMVIFGSMNRIPVIFAIIVAIMLPTTAQAIPPPDFLFQFGSSFLQIFSILFVILGATFSVLSRWSVHVFHKMKKKWVSLVIALLIAVGLSAGVAYLIDHYRYNQALENFAVDVSDEFDSKINKYDKLTEEAPVEEVELGTYDPQIGFIVRYYENIGNRNIQDAYNVSKQNVSFATYYDWYKDVDETVITSVEEVGLNEFSINVSLHEEGMVTRYAALMTLSSAVEPITIIESTVRVLSSEVETEGTVEQTDESDNYLSDNPDTLLFISNDEFAALDTGTVLLLDAREDEEYEIGNYPGSTHIRFADLLAGHWIDLPTDQEIIVICWSGIRGQEVAEFLRSKNLAARYLEDGANGWVTYGGYWEGEISFLKVYSAERHTITFETDEVRDYVSNGVLLIDSRDNDQPIRGGVNISTIFTPTAEFDELFAQIPPGSTVITVCDGFMNCFDAKLTGIKLEKRGHTFLGRYAKPYEY